MRAVVASDCSPSGSTGQVVAMISCPLALSNTPNSVRFTDQPSAHSCSVVKRSRTCPPPDARNSTMSRWPYHPACLAWHWPPCRECAERPQEASPSSWVSRQPLRPPWPAENPGSGELGLYHNDEKSKRYILKWYTLLDGHELANKALIDSLRLRRNELTETSKDQLE